MRVAPDFDVTANKDARYAALASLFDGATRDYLLRRGLSDGWTCLEVGAGRGTIAEWMADRVGPAGRVVATDVDIHFIAGLRRNNLEILQHDVRRDPLPDIAFDLVHTRMVLVHLPERDQVLRRLASALKPGGWLVCEEPEALAVAADLDLGEIDLAANHAMGRVQADCQADRRYGRRLPRRFRELGLLDIGVEGRITLVQAGSPFAALMRASFELRRDAMISAGYLTEREFNRSLELLRAPDFLMPSPMLWTAWGRRA
jgi:SAM-dependent methyltransferase